MYRNSILIGGDFLPTQVNYKYFSDGRIEEILDEKVIELFKEHAFSIVNLEGPITNENKSIIKSGPALKAPKEVIRGFKQLGLNCCSLANNHIMDYGPSGLNDTIGVLRQHGIDFLGAGSCSDEAKKPIIKCIESVRVGFFSCCEYEFSIAEKSTPGANVFDPLITPDYISQIKETNEIDYLVVLFHGGKEYFRYPSPGLQRICHKLIEKGADLVLCQHSHCIGCKEDYKQGVICYGQGNFLLSKYDNEYVSTGLLVSVDLSIKKPQFIPVLKTEKGVCLANNDFKENILTAFIKRTDEIKDKSVLQSKYAEYAEKMLPQYFSWVTGVLGGVSRKIGFTKVCKWMFRRSDKLNLLNILRCDAHREIFIEGLKHEIYK